MIAARHWILAFRATLALAVVAILYLATTPSPPTALASIGDKLQHALAFTVLAFLADYAAPAKPFGWAKALPVFAFGALIEAIQFFLPWRTASGLDLLADAAGIAFYLPMHALFARVPPLAWLRVLRGPA